MNVHTRSVGGSLTEYTEYGFPLAQFGEIMLSF